jgi:hypothetical protein
MKSIVIVVFVIFVIGYIKTTTATQKKEFVCVESSKIKSIISMHYRSGKIELENGKIIEVDQPQTELKDGFNYCLKKMWMPIKK